MDGSTKLKFACDEAMLDRLQGEATFRHLAGQRLARSRTNSGTYFDTKSFALREAGLVWSVCSDGSAFVQTIVSAEDPARGDLSIATVNARPRLARISDGPLRNRIAKLIKSQKLEAIASFQVRRVSVVLTPTLGTQIEAVFETGRMTAGSDSLPLADLELVLLQGEAASFIDCARTLATMVPLLPATHSNAERAYALAGRVTLTSVRPRPPVLSARAGADEAFGIIIAHCLGHLLDNVAPVATGRDPEGVHQMRVALRRLRSAFTLLGKPARKAMDAIEQEVRWLSNVLGKVRDLDVFIADALAPAVAAHGDDERLRELSTLARARQQAASDDLLEALAGARFRNLAFDLAAASIRPPWRADDVGGRRQKDSLSARRFAREQLARRHARVLKFGKRIGEMDSAARHRLRIKLKKLRYAAEFFGSMLPRRKTARFLARLSELQDVLGGLNDSTVARALTAELVSQRPDPAGADSIYAAGVVIGWRLGHARDHSHELERRWRKFAKTDWI